MCSIDTLIWRRNRISLAGFDAINAIIFFNNFAVAYFLATLLVRVLTGDRPEERVSVISRREPC